MKKRISFINSVILLYLILVFMPSQAMSDTPQSSLSNEEVEKLSQSGSFKTISKVSELPPAVQNELGEMADPGKPFNSGCVRIQDLPSQALNFAAQSKDRLWMGYQSGGFCLVNRIELFDLSGSKPKRMWSTVAPHPISSMDDLVKTLKKELSKKN